MKGNRRKPKNRDTGVKKEKIRKEKQDERKYKKGKNYQIPAS